MKFAAEETPHELYTWNFNILTFTYQCQESDDCVFSRCDFVTAGGNIQASTFKYFCIIDKKTSYRVNKRFSKDFLYFLSGVKSSTKLGLCQIN